MIFRKNVDFLLRKNFLFLKCFLTLKLKKFMVTPYEDKEHFKKFNINCN